MTQPAPHSPATEDVSGAAGVRPNRLHEGDADYVRLHARTVERLAASIQQLVRDLRRASQPGSSMSVPDAQRAFIARHTALLSQAYQQAHTAGVRQYFARVSAQPDRWTKAYTAGQFPGGRVGAHGMPQPIRHHTGPHPDQSRVQQRLLFYAASSVPKMASEAARALHAQQVQQVQQQGQALAEMAEAEQHDAQRILLNYPDPAQQGHWHSNSGGAGGISSHVGSPENEHAAERASYGSEGRAYHAYESVYHGITIERGHELLVTETERAVLPGHSEHQLAHAYIRLLGARPGDRILVGVAEGEHGTHQGDQLALYRVGADGSRSHLELGRLTTTTAEDRGLPHNTLVAHVPMVESASKSVSNGRDLVDGLHAMQELGVARVYAFAAGQHGSEWNGYDTWAKLGAHGLLPEDVRGPAAAHFGQRLTRVEQVMHAAGGPLWWRLHGRGFNATLDLTADGETSHILARLQAILERRSNG